MTFLIHSQLLKHGILMAFAAVLALASPAPLQARDTLTLISKIESELEIDVVYERHVTDTWKLSKYRLPEQGPALNRYLGILYRELSHYSPAFLQKARATIIVLTENYHFNGYHQAAMPDPYGNRLYLAIDGAYGDSSEEYLVHVIHHELNHNTEYAIWADQYYKWTEWSNLNGDFQYGDGGRSAYDDDSGTDYYTMVNPRPGFLNLYSMKGQEEDRSEIIAFLMSDLERPGALDVCARDSIVREKARLYSDKLEEAFRAEGGLPHFRRAAMECYNAG